ncbi:adenylosuccinate synthase [Candidatus Sumerlaeota bacterium]|nr:adenylosuccinate synthase [Candidatus Sumerlaeota bacterium]
MSVKAVVGANWGDEGKGKITDYLAGESDIVVRFQGGRNAGHTIINSYGKSALHLLPSGVFYPHVINILGPGMAFDPVAFFEELQALRDKGVPEPQVRVSDRVQVVLPLHVLFDEVEEERLGKAAFGSTKKGIAPFYSDKYAKVGVQVADLYDEKRLLDRLERNLVFKNVLLEHLYDRPPVSAEEIAAELKDDAEKLRPFVCDTSALLYDALAQNKRILLEGQLGALRDPDHGIHPFVTSSSPLAGFASVGAGMPPGSIRDIVAVTKTYSSCVGAGPFVTELFGDEAHQLRERGGDAGEYGATTGRPRRVGWFDAVATRYGCRIQGATEVALTNLDVFGYLDEVRICAAYEVDGRRTTDFPNPATLERAKGVYETLPGWKTDIRAVRAFGDLPPNAQRYVERVEELLEVRIGWVSVGPNRDEIFRR